MMDLSPLVEILPPAVIATVVVFWLFLRYYRQLESFFGDLQCLYFWAQGKWETSNVNRALLRSCEKCKEQPVFKGIEGDVIVLTFHVDPESKGKLELRGKNRAVATIPQLNVESVAKYARKHIQQHVMPLFFIQDIERLRKSMELVYLKLLFDQLGFDGAYHVAIYKILKEEFNQPHIERLFSAFIRVNEELKKKSWVDRRILKIILLETCKMELKLGCR